MYQRNRFLGLTIIVLTQTVPLCWTTSQQQTALTGYLFISALNCHEKESNSYSRCLSLRRFHSFVKCLISSLLRHRILQLHSLETWLTPKTDPPQSSASASGAHKNVPRLYSEPFCVTIFWIKPRCGWLQLRPGHGSSKLVAKEQPLRQSGAAAAAIRTGGGVWEVLALWLRRTC